MKNSNDTIGNRTRDRPACRVVPQPSAPPRNSGMGEAGSNYRVPTMLRMFLSYAVVSVVIGSDRAASGHLAYDALALFFPLLARSCWGGGNS